MKKLLTLSLMAIVLGLGAAVQAADTQVLVQGGFTDNPAVTWGDFLGSGAWAVAANAEQGVDDNSQFFPSESDTFITSTVPGAGAMAGTMAGMVAGQGVANTNFGNASAYAYAQQEIQFRANTGGTLTFTLNYTYSQTMSLGLLPGESAYADTSVGLYLYSATGALLDSDEFYDLNSGPGSFGNSGVLTVSGMFGEDGIGSVLFRVDGNAVAAIVPAPGALLLGALGTGLVGFLRRRVF